MPPRTLIGTAITPTRTAMCRGRRCRSREAFLDGVRRDMDGEPVGVSVYAAAPFRFGQTGAAAADAAARVVVETWPADADEPAQRVSLHPGEGLRLSARWCDWSTS